VPDHFAHSDLKLTRAKKHIADVDTIIRSLPDAYVVTIERDDKTRQQSLKYNLPNAENIALEIALVTGDAIHNLRTALDYAWVGTIGRLVPSALDSRTKFPVYATRKDLEGALRGRKIDVASPALFKWIASDIMPYAGGNDPLYNLHNLDISDKHTLLIPLMHITGVVGIVIENEMTGEISKGNTLPATGPGPHFIPFEWEWRVKEKGKPSVDVLFNEESTLYGLAVSDMLSIFSNLTFSILQSMKYL
jgi:hypothetical protein